MFESCFRYRGAALGGAPCIGYGHCLQALEGPKTQMVSLYGRFVRETRLHQAALLGIGLVSAHAVPQWAMIFAEAEPRDRELYAKLVEQAPFNRASSEVASMHRAMLKPLRSTA